MVEPLFASRYEPGDVFFIMLFTYGVPFAGLLGLLALAMLFCKSRNQDPPDDPSGNRGDLWPPP